ncbi:hypothetical protein Tco_1067064 [Tanacetum coccineum]|uniref:Uncharacterized protein n=1 Tax=Tanacetum coccineum TaxID=301880 RepID=A0ABQ5HDH8_9ASTR
MTLLMHGRLMFYERADALKRRFDALERRAVELARHVNEVLMLWNNGFGLRKIKPKKHFQCLRLSKRVSFIQFVELADAAKAEYQMVCEVLQFDK